MPGSRGWQWYVAFCAVLALVYPLLPWEHVQAVLATLLHFCASGIILAGVRIYRPALRWPWYALAARAGLFAVGDIAYWTQSAFGQDVFPSWADAFYVPSNLALIAALIGFTLSRHTGWDRPGLIDAAVLTIGASMLAWLYLISPTAGDGTLSLFAQAVSLAYPILDLTALAVLFRLTIGAGKRPFAYRLLVAGVSCLLVTDIAYTLLELEGLYSAGGLLDGGWFFSHALLAAAALHPSMPAISQATAPLLAGVIGRRRLYGLAAASLMAPLVLLLEWLRGGPIDAPLIAFGSIALYLLVLARLHGVVEQLDDSLQTARTQAHTDQLTGLANRRLFHDRWQQNLSGTAGPTALLYVDLDGFKKINDTLGHESGDVVLRTVAERISAVVRSGDVVARLGGDEFAVILPGASDEHADDIASRILATISRPIDLDGHRVSVGASIGVLLAPPGADPEQSIKSADSAMYAAKTGGRGQIRHAS
ncbi:GGDEF domain-containing protein [Kineosporia babensis]|uniref:GGDEF domain-containing protein n=1 Tax=Kineosporia babensis TaxID=499548 RepID=A0A9X1NJB1_9ACTN|nr:GGDEF domain-containing protein [Kineosporia babensis]